MLVSGNNPHPTIRHKSILILLLCCHFPVSFSPCVFTFILSFIPAHSNGNASSIYDDISRQPRGPEPAVAEGRVIDLGASWCGCGLTEVRVD